MFRSFFFNLLRFDSEFRNDYENPQINVPNLFSNYGRLFLAATVNI
jgi:hypothetical protein